VFRDVSRAVGVKDLAGEGMAVPALGPGEFPEFCGLMVLRLVMVLASFLNVTPTGGGEGRWAEAERAAVCP